MMTPDAAFAAITTAAAAAFAHQPPYIAYRVDAKTSASRRSAEIVRDVVVRTADDVAVLTDPATGASTTGPSYPLPPGLDGLAHWQLVYHDDNGVVWMAARGVDPLHVSFASPPPNADAVVQRVRDYTITFAPTQPPGLIALHLEPGRPEIRARLDDPDNLIYENVVADARTMLPVRLTFRGSSTQLGIDYTIVDGTWVIRSVTYSSTKRGPLPFERLSYALDAGYSAYAFPGALPAPSETPYPARP